MSIDPAIDATLRVALGLLFLVAAGHKLRAPARFRAALADYRLLPPALVPVAAVLVVAAELGVTAALAVPAARLAGLVDAAALLLVYAAAIGVNLARGRREIDCGCAGPALRRPLDGRLVGRNAVAAAAALAALAPVAPRALVWVDALTVAGGAAVLAAAWASVDRLLAEAPRLARLREGA
jgi:Methylamine utilisation protein MauE